MSGQDAKQFVRQFFLELTGSLQRGESVLLHGLGKFSPEHRQERPGRNPRTGEPYRIPEREVVSFHSATGLRRMLRRPVVGDLSPADEPTSDGATSDGTH